MIKSLDFLIAKRCHVALLAFLVSIFYVRCLGLGHVHPFVFFISFFVVWAAYLENLTTDKKEDALGHVVHGLSPALASRAYPLEKFYPLAYLIAIVLAWAVNTLCFLYTAGTVLIFSAYVHRWIPSFSGRRKRVKEIYILKNVIVAAGWLGATFIVPLAASGSKFIYEYLYIMILIFSWSFREEIRFDIPDADSDLAAGIRTLPNTLGEAQTKMILNFLSYFGFILFFITLTVLKENQRIREFDSLFYNMFPFLSLFLADSRFSDLLFEKRRKEYCNIGVAWWGFLLALYLLLPAPINVVVFLTLRIIGGFGPGLLDSLLRSSLSNKITIR